MAKIELSLIQYLEKVENMRNLQKDYFKTRDRFVLSQAKAAEIEVDEINKRFRHMFERHEIQVKEFKKGFENEGRRREGAHV